MSRATATPGRDREGGYALITVLMLLALVMALLSSYFMVSILDLESTSSSMRTVRGFYASEAGLNLRSDVVRNIILGSSLPGGTAPNTGPGQTPCATGNLGSGDLACVDYTLQNRDVSTYVEADATNPVAIVVPRGERYQNLAADEYRYVVGAISNGRDGRAEAMLEMNLRSREVPLFQFAAFYGKDLEILPGTSTTLSGPVHTNGDLYLDPGAALDIQAQVTAAGSVYRGSKHQDACAVTTLQVLDPVNLAALPACGGSRAELTRADLLSWNGMVRTAAGTVDVPGVQELEPTAGRPYWDSADFRIVLNLNGPPTIEVRAADGSVNAPNSATLGTCAPAATHSSSLYNQREASYIEMLDVDVEVLLDCLHSNALMGGKDLDDTTDGGLVFYLGVDGPSSGALNSYGVRLRNGAELKSSIVTAPAVVGLTVVTDQALYVEGDYNAVNKKPSALLADSFNVLSNNWSDANSSGALPSRVATSTTIRAAVLAGTDTTGGNEGATGQDLGLFNGGLENLPRLHETWTGQTLNYRGSLVSLDAPQHVSGAWAYGSPQFENPVRDWDYDVDFDAPAKLPPLTPRFTYFRQEVQLRRFEL